MVFSQDWVDFGSYPVKEHQVVNLCWNCYQCYSAIILGDREVAFFGDWQQASFSPSIYGSWLCTLLQKSNNTWWKSSIFQTCAASCRCLRFWQISSVSHGVRFLILGFNGMVSAAVSLHANSKWLYFVLALFVRVVSCRAANLFFTLVIRCCVFQGCLLDVSSRMEKCCCSSFYFLEDSDVFGWRRHDGLTLR